jgi:hypothetical protein
MWRDSIVAKLRQTNRSDLADPLQACHQERSVRVCTGCKSTRIFWNRCELKHCPICAARLARERRAIVELWSHQITQPKHVVLTCLNPDWFTKDHLQWFKRQFRKLLNRKICRDWKGGFYSVETTWKENGPHVHMHILTNAKWINLSQLKMEWGELMGQHYAICDVKDARGESYLKEVCKYVVKGSEMAAWTGSKIAAYLDGIAGVRMFGVFGSLYKQRREMREFLDDLQSLRNVCTCGCRVWEVHDAHCWEIVHGTAPPFEADIPPPRSSEGQVALL